MLKFLGKVSDLLRDGMKQNNIAALFYSLGTIGTRKGVILMYQNFITSSLMVTIDQDRFKEPKNVFLCFLPMLQDLCLR